MTNIPKYNVPDHDLVPIFLRRDLVSDGQLNAIMAVASTMGAVELPFGKSRTYGPRAALLGPRERAGLDEHTIRDVLDTLPSCGYGGLLLRDYGKWNVARTQASITRSAAWFAPLEDTVTVVARRIDPANSRYGVFLVDSAAMVDPAEDDEAES